MRPPTTLRGTHQRARDDDTPIGQHPFMQRSSSLVLGVFFGVLVAVVVVAHAAPAVVDVSGGLDAAKAAAKAGRLDDALRALDEVRRTLSVARGLRVEVAEVTQGPHRGLGVWEPVPDGLVPGRTLHLTLEVDGVTPLLEADGRFRHELDVKARFVVVGEGGEEPLGERQLGRHSVVSRRAQPLHVVGAEVGLGTKAPAGAYAADVVVRDVASGHEVVRRVRFRLAP
jgi:hypothetical protein